MSFQALKTMATVIPGSSRIRQELKKAIGRVTAPATQSLHERLDQLERQVQQTAMANMRVSTPQDVPNPAIPQWVPPGHFFSPIPNLDELKPNMDALFQPREMVGIDLREQEQLILLQKLAELYLEQPFSAQKHPDRRYAFENGAYSYGDGLGLYSMIRHLKPKRIIEVGSGYSSCVMLDTNELFFDNEIDLQFIEPYPKLLYSLARESERTSLKVIPTRVQDLPLDTFSSLESGDILFIDSTHVAKIGGDVPYLYFEVLPRLPKGVFVHIHDVFYPMEYPKHWILEGRSWNEQYILQAFLTFNSRFEIVYYSRFMGCKHRSFYEQNMPLYLKNIGAQIWLRS